MTSEWTLPPELAVVADDEAGRMIALRGSLAAAALRQGLVDIAYRVMDSPVGPLLLAATERGLLRVAFAVEGHEEVLEQLAVAVSPRLLQVPARLDAAAREIDEYFSRQRRSFDLPLDLHLAQGFRREVLSHLLEIKYGQTASYAQVAAMTSSPRAVRAVGTACARNPLPLVVPCHRVVRSDGATGAYLGGADSKKLLLSLESHPL